MALEQRVEGGRNIDPALPVCSRRTPPHLTRPPHPDLSTTLRHPPERRAPPIHHPVYGYLCECFLVTQKQTMYMVPPKRNDAVRNATQKQTMLAPQRNDAARLVARSRT